MKKSLISSLAITTLLVTGCAKKTEQEFLLEIQTALTNGQIAQAEILAKQAITEQSSDALRLLLAEIYLKRGDIIGSGKELERITFQNLSSEDKSLAEQLNAHISLLNFDTEYTALTSNNDQCKVCELVSLWSNAINNSGPTDNVSLAEYPSVKAIQLWSTGELASMVPDDLLEDIRFDEELLIIADVMRRAGNTKGVVDAYSRYAERYPDTVNIYLPFAQAYIITGNYAEADKLISKTLRRFEKNPVANYLKSLIFLNKSDFNEALNSVSLAQTYGMASPSVSVTKGLLEFHLKNYESALSSFQQAAQLDPSNNVAKTMLTATQVKLGIEDEALAQLASHGNYSAVDLASIGQLIGHAPESSDWQKIQTNLIQNTSSTSVVLDGLVNLIKNGESEVLNAPGDELDDGYNLIRLSMLLNSKQFPQALEFVNNWLEKAENKLDVLNYKGAIQAAMGDRDAALATYQTALEIDPNNRSSHLFAAQSNVLAKNHDGALDNLETILKHDPTDLVALKLYAAFERIVSNSEYQDKLFGFINSAIDSSTQKTPYQLLKAGFLTANGHYPLSDATINEVDAEVGQQINQYWEILFYNAANQNKLRDAERVYEDWKRAFPASSRPVQAIATFFEQNNMLKKAIALYEKPINSAIPREQKASIDAKLATLYIRVGETDKAKRKIDSLSREATIPASVISYLKGFLAYRNQQLDSSAAYLSESYQASKASHTLKLLYSVNTLRGKDSKALLESHLKEFQNDNAIRILLAESLIGKDNDRAISLFDSVVLSGVKNPVVFNNYAWTLYLVNRDTDASTYAEQAVELAPDSTEYLDTLFRVLSRLGEFEKVIAHAEKANSPQTQLLLANAYASNNDEARAKSVLSKIDQSTLSSEDKKLFEQLK